MFCPRKLRSRIVSLTSLPDMLAGATETRRERAMWPEDEGGEKGKEEKPFSSDERERERERGR